ncbi:glutamate--cysteine ligase, partial [Acinetobacter baumannii]
DAQATLAVSYNGLQGYANSLHEALTKPYPAYEQLGVRNPGGDYNQLGTSLLQIENEFYGTIRPKRTVRTGERPLHALRERGVEYVEVRLMDIDP